MTCYVDNAEHSFGRYVMCHLWADSRDELFAMVDIIGVKRKWFQQPPKASWEHFDIAKSKRALAVQNGAIEVCQFTMAEHANRQQFIIKCQSKDFDKASRHLRMMMLAYDCRMRRND